MPSNSGKATREWAVVDNLQILPNKYVMNWNEGMLKQCFHVGELYHEWIEHAKLRRVRMFDSDYIESASFTPWWVVPALYIPWSMLELDLSYQDMAYNHEHRQSVLVDFVHHQWRVPLAVVSLFMFVIGVLMWTLFEYFVHKHAFHWSPPSPAWNLAHFIGHGMHHLTPADEYRLVFPPAVSFPLGLIVRSIFYGLLFPLGLRSAAFSGMVFGYACYESIHYLSHHCPKGKYLQERFRQHNAHHFNPAKQDMLFGVSCSLWDYAFDTI